MPFYLHNNNYKIFSERTVFTWRLSSIDTILETYFKGVLINLVNYNCIYPKYGRIGTFLPHWRQSDFLLDVVNAKVPSTFKVNKL